MPSLMLLEANADKKNPVTVVPTFAPTAQGNIFSKRKRHTATNGVNVEVVTLLEAPLGPRSPETIRTAFHKRMRPLPQKPVRNIREKEACCILSQ